MTETNFRIVVDFSGTRCARLPDSGHCMPKRHFVETKTELDEARTETVNTCLDTAATSADNSPPATQPAALSSPPTLLPFERITGAASSRVFVLDAGSVLHIRVIKADGTSVLLSVDG